MTNRPLALLRSGFAVTLLAGAMTLSANGNAVGKPSGGGSSYEWQTSVTGHDRIELTVVAPDGEVYVRQFNAGRDPSFRLSDLKTAADGQYAYELRVVPKVTPDLQRKLQDARENNDDAAARKIMRQAGLDKPVVQSGVITILNGAIVSPDLVEATAHDDAVTGSSSSSGRSVSSNAHSGMTPVVNDQVIADDLIVQGSTCVGLDCVANESFGFDTIRLKENNTRIKFDDTSASTGFPANDWQLTANDSASGGASKFSVEDITGAKVPMTITAGASTNSIFVDSTGRVGFRTSTPVLDLHVATSNTPAIRLEQNSSGGFTAQTWDVAGNEANFFVRDVTSGSRLPFRIRPGAPTSSIDIAASGNVGIGTASPSAKLHVVGNASVMSGSLGVGTTSPLSALHVTSSAPGTTVARFQNSSPTGYTGFSMMDHLGTFRMFVGVDNANSTASVSSFGTSPLLLLTNGLERVRVDTSGNVGIGTSSPLSRLHVNGGDIRITGGSFIDDGTSLNVPDYVFENEYKLMPVGELAAFIRENKHLPNVPSETDVKQRGVNLSSFQMRLLEKVEELTLYTIDQHDRIGALQAQNRELLDRLAALEEKMGAKEQ